MPEDDAPMTYRLVSGVSKVEIAVRTALGGRWGGSVSIAGEGVEVRCSFSPWVADDNDAMGATIDIGGSGGDAPELLRARAPHVELGGSRRGSVVLSPPEETLGVLCPPVPLPGASAMESVRTLNPSPCATMGAAGSLATMLAAGRERSGESARR